MASAYAGHAGYIAERKTQAGVAVLYLAESQGIDPEGGKYAAVCEAHGTICNFSSKGEALRHLSSADWCEACQELAAKGPEQFVAIPRSDAWDENGGCSDEHLPCIVCNRTVKHPRHWLHVVDGGASAVHPSFEPYDGGTGDLYMYPVGADCLRQHPELKPYTQTVPE